MPPAALIKHHALYQPRLFSITHLRSLGYAHL
jgi:hypothetical protein